MERTWFQLEWKLRIPYFIIPGACKEVEVPVSMLRRTIVLYDQLADQESFEIDLKPLVTCFYRHLIRKKYTENDILW